MKYDGIEEGLEHDPRAKLNKAKVLEIKEELYKMVVNGDKSITIKKLSEKYSVTGQCIRDIAHGRNWKHVKLEN